MARITQDMKYRLSLLRYFQKYGVSKTAVKYKTNRQYIYRWKSRFDGSIESLRCCSRRPHHHPNEYTAFERNLILDMHRRNSHVELVVFWVKLRRRGYSRSITGLYRFFEKAADNSCPPFKSKVHSKALRENELFRSAHTGKM